MQNLYQEQIDLENHLKKIQEKQKIVDAKIRRTKKMISIETKALKKKRNKRIEKQLKEMKIKLKELEIQREGTMSWMALANKYGY
jgi:hypothetical protein